VTNGESVAQDGGVGGESGSRKESEEHGDLEKLFHVVELVTPAASLEAQSSWHD
jgi:hypothetical protein